MSDEESLRGLPTWLQWRAIYPNKSDREVDVLTERSIENPDTKLKTRQIATCQASDDNKGIAKSYKKQLGPNWRTYQRVALFSPTGWGHNAAKKYAEEIKYETYGGEEGENLMVTDSAEHRSVKVLKIYCRDTDPKGMYWTVWVGIRRREGYFGTDEIPKGTEGTQNITYAYRSGLRESGQRSYHSGMTKKYKSVECPKCEAPVGQNCTKSRQYPEAIRMLEAGELTRAQAFGNPHAERRKKYREEQEREEDVRDSE